MSRVNVVDLATRMKRREYNQRHYRKKKAQLDASAIQERKVLCTWRLPENLIGRLHRCVTEGVATGRYPWKTATEAVKDLLIRGFSTLRGDDGIIDEMWPHLEMMQQLDRMEAQKREAQVVLNKARDVIGELLGIKAYESAITYYHVTMDAAQKMPPTVWRDWLIGKLQEAFPDLAKEQARGVALTTQKDERKAKPKPAKKGRR